MIQYRGLKVRLIADLDLSLALQWRNDFAVWRTCRQHTLIDAESQDRWWDRVLGDPTVKMFGIQAWTEATEARAGFFNDPKWRNVGVCGLTSINPRNQSAEFSLYIGPEFRQRGHALDGLLTLFKHGFDDFNLNRIWGETFDGNEARTLFCLIGMVSEGRLREAYFRSGKFVDSHIVSFLRREFYALYRDRLGDCLEYRSAGTEPNHHPIPGEPTSVATSPSERNPDGTPYHGTPSRGTEILASEASRGEGTGG